jgi:glutaredoxin 3|tara:strand:+ start:792 stop:1043 length:252 start_codon:yes stop_codon:yes gene_type:complete
MIEIYGKPACPYCEKAKALCEMRKIKYSYKSLGTDFTREELLESFPDARTVPQIMINGKKIGGYDQLVKYIEETGYTGTGWTL